MDNQQQQTLQAPTQEPSIVQPEPPTIPPTPTPITGQSQNVKKGFGKKWLFLGLMLILFALIGGITVFYFLNTDVNKKISCASDAKVCPDGKTAVTRVAPNCEFAKCPESKTPISPEITAITAPINENLTEDCIVVGCGNEICLNREDDNAPTYQSCDNLPIYACYKSAKCEIQQNGKCGWTQTQELKTCLANTK